MKKVFLQKGKTANTVIPNANSLYGIRVTEYYEGITNTGTKNTRGKK